jgi:hypothetical protein
MTRTQVYIQESELLEAKIIAKSLDKNLSELIRMALKNEIEKIKKQTKSKK